MFPVLPSKTSPELDQLIFEVTTASAALGKGIHPLILNEISRLMVKVNSYYTNAMEGNPSKLKDIDAALDKNLAKDKTARDYQKEHLAHIEVQELMIERLSKEPDLRICSERFLCWIHEQFYSRLSADMRFAKTESGQVVPVIPGQLRERGVSVGKHRPPTTKDEVRTSLDKFEEFLSPENLLGPQKLLGMASSHHRFLWIHPFPDGNGRVARLLTIAYGCKIGIETNMLWTVTRAFARKRPDYDAHLEWADQERRNDLDGRGPLSEENLVKFCAFFLQCCQDQIQYMDAMLKLNEFERRYKRFIDRLVEEKQLSKAEAKVAERLLYQGEIRRAQVLDICDVKQRRATQIVKRLLDAKITRSETAYGALRLNISADMASVLFPGLA